MISTTYKTDAHPRRRPAGQVVGIGWYEGRHGS
jgi:hypothetical protein